jgi:hypothetical protein
LEAFEEEEVELSILRGLLVGGLLDEVDKLLLAHIFRVASQVILK